MACILPATIREQFYRDCPSPLERKGEASITRIWIRLSAVGAEVVEAAPDTMTVRRYTEVVGAAALAPEARDLADNSIERSLILGMD